MAVQVVLGNGTTENSLVHDVKVLKSDVEMDKEQDRQLVSRMDSVKTASDQLRQDPLDLSFWSFLTFLHHGIEEVERHLL